MTRRHRLRLTIRAIRPDDAGALREGLRRLSPRTRYQRFHAAISHLTPEQWVYLTDVDGHDHVALVACLARRTEYAEKGAIVGVARFIRDRDEPTVAEVAFVVYDDLQGHGVGSALRDALIAEARARGVRTFRAHVLPDNGAMRRLLRGLVFLSERDGVIDVRLDRFARSA
jgi:RimJ/RimL family protein N-acetyltransferase